MTKWKTKVKDNKGLLSLSDTIKNQYIFFLCLRLLEILF